MDNPNNKNYTAFADVPKLIKPRDQKIDDDLNELLHQMVLDAENGRKTEISDDHSYLYELYKTFQGVRFFYEDVIKNKEAFSSKRRFSIKKSLLDTPKSNPFSYFDYCRSQLRALMREKQECSKVFIRERKKQLNTILNLIRQDDDDSDSRPHIKIVGSPGTGKTVLAKEAVKRYHSEMGIDAPPKIVNLSSTSHSFLFASLKLKQGSTEPSEGLVNKAAREGSILIIEEYNVGDEHDILNKLKSLQPYLDKQPGDVIALDEDNSIVIKKGFMVILTGNPADGDAIQGVVSEDEAFNDRVRPMTVAPLTPKGSLLQFIVMHDLLDDNLGLYLPQLGLYEKLKSLFAVSHKAYRLNNGENVLTEKQSNDAGLYSNDFKKHMITQRVLTNILNDLKRNDFVDSIDDVILSTYLSKYFQKKDYYDQLRLAYTLFYFEGFFQESIYPVPGDENLIQKLMDLNSNIDLSPIEMRLTTNYSFDPDTFLNDFNSLSEEEETHDRGEYIGFVQIFKDCFGDMPSSHVTYEVAEKIVLDENKVKLTINIVNDAIKKMYEIKGYEDLQQMILCFDVAPVKGTELTILPLFLQLSAYLDPDCLSKDTPGVNAIKLLAKNVDSIKEAIDERNKPNLEMIAEFLKGIEYSEDIEFFDDDGDFVPAVDIIQAKQRIGLLFGS